MKTAGIILVCLVGCCVDFSRAKGVNLGICDPKFFSCLCGETDFHARVKVKQCSYTHRWKMRCRPCKDVSEEELCRNYRRCLTCFDDGKDRCLSCPPNKFGTWCENDCKCVNGGSCEQDGKCNCLEMYEGRYCEKKKGCPPPGPITPPLEVVLTPPNRPVTAVYSCPSNFELSGPSVSTCNPNDQWSSPPPKCLPACPLLSAPANGRLKFSANELVEGVTATVTCNPHHRLLGTDTLVCLAEGQWNGELPSCDKLATCPDPGLVKNAQRDVPLESIKVGGHFLEDSKIYYKCLESYEQMGTDTILCQHDGKWSDDLPSCVKVSTVVPDCFTKGSQIISNLGESVRIVCPPECVDEDFSLWGTSIYRADSSVCQAAIHSAKITNSGGAVAVIDNGEYSHFTGSFSNQVQSDSYDDRDESFRFDRLPPLSRSRNAEECGKGLMKLEKNCAYISNTLRTFEEAKAVCTNLGLHLQLPELNEDRVRLILALNSKGITSIWKEKGTEIPNETPTANETLTLTPEEKCSGVAYDHLEFKAEIKNCREVLNFACIKTPEENALAICPDPGPIKNGKAEAVGKIDDVFYVGSSILYTCQSLHFLRGASTISCTVNGSWSDPMPSCIKVNACQDPPVPYGGYITYLEPYKTQAAQRSAIHRPVHGTGPGGARSARLPVGLSVELPSNASAVTTAAPEVISLPPGFHRIGSSAMYDCESKYYKLIGSMTRRCQGQGEWSGRPPTCIPVCGRSDSPRTPFIVNGNATDVGQWPWQAGLARFIPDLGTWFVLCGGSLLNERWLLTAAHCVTYADTTLLIDSDKFRVYLGKYHRQDDRDDDLVQVRKVQEIHIHPDYEPVLYESDIALIQLDAPVQLTNRVKPVCLPTEQTSKKNLVEGTKGVVTGWGMNENEKYADTLQQAVLPVVSNENCEKGYEESELPLTVTDNMFCAGYEQGKADACSGDSGGPMVFLDTSSVERKWVLEGVVSWGSPRGCGNPKQYGGFTAVSKFLDWINLFI